MDVDFLDIHSNDQKVTQIIASSAITTIDDVIAVLQDIDDTLPSNDGLKWFNLLYLKVTEGVRDNPPTESWEDPQWLGRLDVEFAKLYFTALASWHHNPDEVTRSWVPLLSSRQNQNITRVQFALAGINAHINHDLPIAVVQTSEEQEIVPRSSSPQHRDFERVNTILEAVVDQAKQFLATGIIGEIDQDLGQIDDLIAVWSVRKARETAWTNAEILWQLRSIPLLNDGFLLSLDRLVRLSSQGLLSPIA
jgi:hypothetical protein